MLDEGLATTSAKLRGLFTIGVAAAAVVSVVSNVTPPKIGLYVVEPPIGVADVADDLATGGW